MSTAANFVMNLDSVEPFSSYIHIPKGEWNLRIASAEFVPEENNKPALLVLTYKVTEGAAQGGEIKENLALWLPKTDDSHGGRGEISRRTMRTLLVALGIHGDFNPSNLVGRDFTANTDLRFGDRGGSFAQVKKIKPFVGQGKAAGADAVQPQAPAAGVAAAAPSVPGVGGFAAPTTPAAPAFAAPAAPAFAAPQAPAMMPPGFPMPGQQTAPAAPAMAVPPMGGFAPPQAPQAPTFAPPVAGGAAPWGAPPMPGR